MPTITIAATGDPLAPGTWSGVPAAVARGLRAQGCEATGVDATPPGGLRQLTLAVSALARRSRVDAWYGDEQRALRNRIVARRMRPSDGAVLCGAEFDLPDGVPYVTLSDLTLKQAREVHPVFQRLSPGVFARWDARQRDAYRRAHACCAASGWTAASLVADYGLDPERVHVVGFARNHEPPARSAGWQTPRFLFVGREWERKGGPALLEAFAALHAERPDAELHLVGAHPHVAIGGVHGHGPLRLDVAAEAERASALFAGATCFVMVSSCEPFGIAYAEAGAAGVPSIGTTVGGAATAIGPGGVLVPPGDPAALLGALRRLADPAEAERLGSAAKDHAELFTAEQVAGRLLRALTGDASLPAFL